MGPTDSHGETAKDAPTTKKKRDLGEFLQDCRLSMSLKTGEEVLMNPGYKLLGYVQHRKECVDLALLIPQARKC